MAVLKHKHSSKARENMTKIKKNGKNDNKKVFLIAQELKLARALAGNNKTSRDHALKSLKKWFLLRPETTPFTEEDFLRIWKGLFYSMWMSDKPLIQEECAENISKLVHFSTLESSLSFFKSGLQTLSNEWFGIDQLRVDKFLMFVRRLLRQGLIVLKNNKWSKKANELFANVISSTILSTKISPPLGLLMHFTEIYLEELAKISEGKVNPERLTDLLRPFIIKLASLKDGREIGKIRQFIFTYLIRQSDKGIEYQEKYNAWKQQGFPGSINSMTKVILDDEKMSDEEEDNVVKPLDPRAGRVDVELPQLKFNAKALAAALLEVKFDKSTSLKSRKTLSVLAEQFTMLASGVYPLGIQRIKVPKSEQIDTNIRKAVNRLVKFDKKIMGKDKKRKRSEDTEGAGGKRLKINLNSDDINGYEDLQKFIEKSESNLEENTDFKKKSKKRKENFGHEKKKQNKGIAIDEDFDVGTPLRKKANPLLNADVNQIITRPYVNLSQVECVFVRNSGTWVVFNESTKLKDKAGLNNSNAELGDFLESKLSSKMDDINEGMFQRNTQQSWNNESTSEEMTKYAASTKLNKKKRLSKKSKTPSPKIVEKEDSDSPKVGLNPVKLFESSPKDNVKEKELFPKSEWDEPLQEGEYEICIPSKKHVGKMKKIAKKNNQNVQELIDDSIQKIKGKNRLSLDAGKVRNPFSPKSSTPMSLKKVKINTKLNISQEVHEHHAQIISSPAIPYDANRKPSKPLLKTPIKSTPVNPFYELRW